MNKVALKLFVTGGTPRSEEAVKNLRLLCANKELLSCEISVIDVRENPSLAEELKVVFTPTLIKESPAPPRRIIGDLSNHQQVMQSLLPLSPRRF
jgi:circadian clock protein KaiB